MLRPVMWCGAVRAIVVESKHSRPVCSTVMCHQDIANHDANQRHRNAKQKCQTPIRLVTERMLTQGAPTSIAAVADKSLMTVVLPPTASAVPDVAFRLVPPSTTVKPPSTVAPPASTVNPPAETWCWSVRTTKRDATQANTRKRNSDNENGGTNDRHRCD